MNKNGTVSKKELKKGMENLGMLLTGAEVDAIIDRLDSKGKNKITLKDFKALTKFTKGKGEKKAIKKQEEEEAESDSDDASSSDSSSSKKEKGKKTKKSPKKSARKSHSSDEEDDDDKSGTDESEEETELDSDGVNLIASEIRSKLSDLSDSVSSSTDKGLHEIFNALDKDNSGALSPAQFKKCLKKLKVKVTDKELKVLSSCFDMYGDGKIHFEEFVNFVHTDVVGDEMGVIKAEIQSQIPQDWTISSMLQLFEKHDKKKTGWTTSSKFQTVLKKSMGVSIDEESINLILETFGSSEDSDDDSVFYEKVMHWIQNGRDDELVKIKVHQFFSVLQKRGTTKKEIFKICDKNGNGKLSAKEFKAAVNKKLSLMITDGEIATLFAAYDADDSGKLDLKEFTKLFDSNVGSKLRKKRKQKLAKAKKVANGKSAKASKEEDSDDDGGDEIDGKTSLTIETVETLKNLAEASEAEGGLRPIFIEIDEKNDGHLDSKVFSTTISELGFSMTKKQLQMLAYNFGVEPFGKVSDAKIDYTALCNFLEYQEESPSLIELIDSICEQLAKRVSAVKPLMLRRNDSETKPLDLMELFSDHDEDGEGLVTKKLFTETLTVAANLVLNKTEVKEIVKRFLVEAEDEEGDDEEPSLPKVDYASFISCVEANDYSKALDHMKRFANNTSATAAQLNDHFKAFSKASSAAQQAISYEDFGQSMLSLGMSPQHA